MLMDVECCKYNHILLGPEQAVAPRFRKILRDPDFAKSVGVVIVDGCHVLSTWGTFRESVTHIRELRLSLPSQMPMYGCTATLTKEQEREALLYGGFQHEGDAVEDLRIIRVNIDRPEIRIRVQPISVGCRCHTDSCILHIVAPSRIQLRLSGSSLAVSCQLT